jgi:OmpA-OmpF porin, OOP family
MRVKSLLLLGTVALCASAPAGASTFKGWYIGLEGGADWTSDNNAAWGTTSPPLNPVRINYDTGWAALATAGYRFDNNLRLEGEIGYRDDDVGSVTGSVTRTGGELTTTTAMANLIYDWPVFDRMTLSIGAGAGAAHEQFDDGTLDQDEDYNFAYQGIAGLSYALSPRTDLTLNYRYLRTDRAEYHGAHLAHTDFYDTDFGDRQTLTIGLRYDLSPDASAPIAAAPPVAPPPPPPVARAAPRQFLVFFGFDKSNLTAEAQGVVAEAAAAAKQYGSASILVVGHADTSGSKQYNQQLSERRADAVRGGLIAQGIDAGKITASGRGETELLVQTGDNVKEPQNRRATIDLP